MINNKTKGIIYILAAALSFALMSAFVKLAGDIPAIQKSFFRNLIAFFVALLIVLKSGEKIRFNNRKNLPIFFARGIFGTLGIFCNFYAIDHLILSDSSMILKLNPFFAVIASYLILKEKIKPYQIVAIIIAFIGSMFIIKPSGNFMASIPALVGVAGAFFAGLAYTMVRMLGKKGEKSSIIVLFFSGFSTLCTLPFFIFNYIPMSIEQTIFLLLAGIAAVGGQFDITNAYLNAPAREISVYDYSQVIFAAIIGFFLYNEIPDIYSMIGYVIIIGIGILVFLRNKNEYEKQIT